MDWDPQTMSGYSDGFSYLENNDVMKKAYSFLDDNEKKTPDESNCNNNNSKSDQVKSQLDNDYENYNESTFK